MDIMGNGGPQVVALRRPGRLGEMHRGWFRDEVITENIGRRSERKRVAQCFVSWKRKVKLSTRNDSCVRGFVLGLFVCVGPQAFFWCKPFQHTATLPRRTTEIHNTTPGQHLHTHRNTLPSWACLSRLVQSLCGCCCALLWTRASCQARAAAVAVAPAAATTSAR